MTVTARQVVRAFRRTICGALAVVLLAAPVVPNLTVLAADGPDCHPVQSASTGTTQPTGSDASTYTYDSCSGLWENAHYTWSPATQQATPKGTQVYTCNASTHKWDSYSWAYSPSTKQWVQVPFSVSQPPSGANIQLIDCPAPATATTKAAGTGPGSTDGTNTSNTSATNLSSNTGASVTNTLDSTAGSGNATIIANTNGGSATSGNAEAIANVINLLQSSSSLGSTAATFNVDINGDVQGDLIIDPSALQPALDSSVNNTNDLDVNVKNDGQITNNLTLDATTGDATVADNTNAGNATSGNAQAVANVVNMIDSMIAANQSFVGVININGNFNGNILMPQKFLDSLIASNAPHSDIAISQDTLNKAAINLSNNTSIANNVSSSASSGGATLANNTNAGSATSGTAKTNVTIFDLTNVQVSGGNTMLVFVNVLGKWVGVLMNAPAGSTAAAFGGGIHSVSNTNTLNANLTNDSAITNNIDTNAHSGDATVRNNTKAGNATSGNAETAINLNNIVNSNFNLSGWFGILFINVFGTWNGNFGVLTPNVPTSAGTAGPGSAAIPQVFGFAPKATAAATHHSTGTTSASSAPLATNFTQAVSKVLADNTFVNPAKAHQQVVESHQQSLLVGLLLFGAGIVVLLGEQARSRFSRRS